MIPVSLTLTPIRQEGILIGSTILFRDISIEKKREENKDEFISIASHELKTPLTSLKLYTDLLMRKVDKKSEYAKYIERLHEEVNKVTTLTNDLLDLSRIRTGDIQLNPEEFNISELITNTKTTLAKTISQKIEIKGTRDPLWVLADQLRISQVLVNLITNASKYAPESEKIIVSIVSRDRDVQIGIQDFGKGIPKSEHKKIFDRFYRTEGVLTATPSLGIGLYVCANIIKRHRGQIWVESEVGKGSTFFFTVPRYLSHSQYLDQGYAKSVVR